MKNSMNIMLAVQQFWLKFSQMHHVAEVMTRFHVSWQVPRHIHNSLGHYSDQTDGNFWRKRVFICISWYTSSFAPFMHWTTPLWKYFLQNFAIFPLYPKEQGSWHLADMTCHIIWHDPVDRIWWHFSPTFPTFSQHVSMLVANMSFGVGPPTWHNADYSN